MTTYQLDGLTALADPTRRTIFELLADRPSAVVELARELPVSRPAVSQHLKVLKRAGLVVDQAAGNRRLYQVHPAGLEAVLLAKPTTPLPELDTEVWIEPAAPRHPLVGLVTALERAGGRAVLALGCDLPLASPELLRWLAGVEPHEAAVVPVVGGRPQPLLARYSSRALDPLRDALTSEMALTAAVASLHPRWVGEAELRRFGDPARMALNVNSPADLERAAALLARRA